MAKSYGIPMQGSKSRIADKIIDLLPSATHFYDLFGGGCALSHAALLSGKFQHVHANDITDSVVLFKDAMEGNLAKYELERFRQRDVFLYGASYPSRRNSAWRCANMLGRRSSATPNGLSVPRKGQRKTPAFIRLQSPLHYMLGFTTITARRVIFF